MPTLLHFPEAGRPESVSLSGGLATASTLAEILLLESLEWPGKAQSLATQIPDPLPQGPGTPVEIKAREIILAPRSDRPGVAVLPPLSRWEAAPMEEGGIIMVNPDTALRLLPVHTKVQSAEQRFPAVAGQEGMPLLVLMAEALAGESPVRAANEAKQKILEEIAAKRKAKRVAQVKAQEEKERKRLLARREKVEKKLRERLERAVRKGKTPRLDSTELWQLDSLLGLASATNDSLAGRGADSLQQDSLGLHGQETMPADSLDSLAGTDTLAVEVDSMYRLVKAFRNVRIYRSDFQSVCDSLTSTSRDSTIHLYLSPVLWNENNQVVSDVMDVYTANRQLTRAEFVGSPMMSSEIDTLHYNQVAGKEMTAYFRDNQIYRNDVDGNAQTIYYMQDGEGGEVTGVMVLDSGNISFFFEEKQVVDIIYRINPVWTIYPLDKVPEEQSLELKGFKWEGARRPTQRDVFDRTIRPSRRAASRELPKPDFPINRALEEHKARLIEERRWIDRNDQVDAETVEWMRTLGYEVGQPRESGPRL